MITSLDWIFIGIAALLLSLALQNIIKIIKHLSYIRKLKKTSIGLHAEYAAPDKSIVIIKMGITDIYICTEKRAQDIRDIISKTEAYILDEGEFETDGLVYFRISDLSKNEYISYIKNEEDEK